MRLGGGWDEWVKGRVTSYADFDLGFGKVFFLISIMDGILRVLGIQF